MVIPWLGIPRHTPLKHFSQSTLPFSTRVTAIAIHNTFPKGNCYFICLVLGQAMQALCGPMLHGALETAGTLLSASPQRHDYNCWGTDQQDVADCVLVRHAGYTITVAKLWNGRWVCLAWGYCYQYLCTHTHTLFLSEVKHAFRGAVMILTHTHLFGNFAIGWDETLRNTQKASMWASPPEFIFSW